MRLFSAVSGIAVCLLLSACSSDAQAIASGAVDGVVHDASGAAIPIASVSLNDAAHGVARNTFSDAFGEFVLNDLPPGVYRLRLHANGFHTVEQDITITLGGTTRIASVLPIAAQAQAIVVTAEDTLPRFDSPGNATFSPAALRALPLDGRRFQTFAILTPHVGIDDTPSLSGDTDSDNVRFSVRGLPPMYGSATLDGLSLTRAFDGDPRGGRALPFTVPLEAVGEFQVRAVDPATARAAGGLVDTVTRRAETTLHGSAFFLFRDSGVGAANPFSVVTHYHHGAPTTSLVKPADRREQFGGSVGRALPHMRQRLFAFAAVEGQRRSFPGVSSPNVPNFYNLSAEQTALLGNRGVSSTQVTQALDFLDSLSGPVDRRADELALFPRLDWQPRATSSISLEWTHVRFRSPGGRHSAPVVDRGRASFGDLVTHADTVQLQASQTLSRRWLNIIRAGYSRDASFATTPTPLQQEPHSGPQGAAPFVSIAGAFAFGNAAVGTRRLPDERRSELHEALHYTGHAHTVRLAFDVSGVDERITTGEASSGAYDYTSSLTGGHAGGLVDFITDYTYSATSYPNGGCPSVFAAVHLFCFESFTQTFAARPQTRFHTAEWSASAGDTWRATPHLRLTLAARYEYVRLPVPQHPNAALDAVFGAFAATSSTPHDTNNLAPSAGIAYAPDAETMVRLGYSVDFARVPGHTLQAALENTAQPASQSQLRLTPRVLLDPACASVGTNFGYPATFTCTPFGSIATTGGATVFARGFQAPTVQTAELSVTRELHRHTTLTGSYTLALDRQLQNTTDLNIAPSTSRVAFRILRNGGEPGARNGDVFNVPLYTARITDAFGPVTAILSNGNGTYHALALQLEQRAIHALTARVAWTYSKALDTVVSTGALPNQNSSFDPFEPLYDRAPSNFDRTHRIVATAIWEPQPNAGHGARHALTTGWTASPLFVASTGRPYSYQLVGGTALSGGRESLNGSGGATYLPSVGRNTLRLPPILNVDLRITRTIAMHGSLRLALSAEAFNLLNHVNATAVEQRAFQPGTAGRDGVIPLQFQDTASIASEGIAAKPFGTVTSSADAPTRERRLQFGIRAEW